MTNFADRLIGKARALGHPLCVGFDPFPAQIPHFVRNQARNSDNPDQAIIAEFARLILDRVKDRAVALKVQFGLFEPFGAWGWALAEDLCGRARDEGLIVIADAKRGDIGTTAQGYADAFLGRLAADCVTVNPYMGLDTLEPFVALAEKAGKGLAVLVKTSNPGAGDFQDLICDGEPVWVHIAHALRPIERRLMGQSGYSSLMVVAGATKPDEARRLREILPAALMLVPGFGAQGASARQALAGFVRGSSDGRLEGGVVNSSRAILYPDGAQAIGSQDGAGEPDHWAENHKKWASLVDQALNDAVSALTAAMA